MKVFVLLWGTAFALAQAQTPAVTNFFETKIRPLLVTRCGSCHGDQVQMSGIQLTSRDGMLRSGTVVPGSVDGSKLVQALRYTNKVKMPPTGKLADSEIQAVEQWIKNGAEWPETSTTVANKASRHWSFEPVRKSEPPHVNGAWARTDIDRFILSKLEEKKLTPVRDADKYTLLRRVTLDLTGLLPTQSEIEAFQKDTSPQAFEHVVDRLLASPAYGDRWGRHWLDITYWADTTGSGRRIPLRESWRYRDYVIRSFNEDKPYNQFIHEQIAGDLLEKKDEKANAATGFLVIGPWAWISYDRVQLRVDVADLQVDLVGRTFLGLTLGCARCHDHKFDPIPNKDYFAMAGIFMSTKTLATEAIDGGINTVRLPETTDQVKRYASDLDVWEKRVAEVEAAEKINQKEQADLKKQLDELKTKPDTDSAKIREVEAQLEVSRKKSGVAGDRQVLAFTRYMRPRMPEVYAARDMDFPENARMTMRGDAHRLGDSVPRGFLSAAAYEAPSAIPPNSSGRKELADWIANEKNPLTARVYVNRIWHHLFGRGIVATTENFGARGESPTHPELLDYLATRLIENQWSTKKTIREVVLSHVYQVASSSDAKSMEIDPDNKLLWKANRRRLEAEAIRDSILEISGQLSSEREGPSLPLTAQNVHTIAPFFLEEDSVIEDRIRNRRTVYQPVMRSGQMTDIDILNLFDFADPDQVVGTRTQTVVPTQTLYLMNSPMIREAARKFADSLLADKTLDDPARISRAILLTLNRPATERETQQTQQFLSDFKAKTSPAEAWTKYCHALFVSSEFLYRR